MNTSKVKVSAMYVIEISGGAYSDKWMYIEGVCKTEEKAKEILAAFESKQKHYLHVSEVVDNMIVEWKKNNPEKGQFDVVFKQEPIPKWDSKNGKMPDDFRANRDLIKSRNSINAEIFYKKRSVMLEQFYSELVNAVKEYVKNNSSDAELIQAYRDEFNHYLVNPSITRCHDISYSYYEVKEFN